MLADSTNVPYNPYYDLETGVQHTFFERNTEVRSTIYRCNLWTGRGLFNWHYRTDPVPGARYYRTGHRSRLPRYALEAALQPPPACCDLFAMACARHVDHQQHT